MKGPSLQDASSYKLTATMGLGTKDQQKTSWGWLKNLLRSLRAFAMTYDVTRRDQFTDIREEMLKVALIGVV